MHARKNENVPGFPGLDFDAVETPCTVVSLDALRRNMTTFRSVRDRSNCRVLLALKGFAMFSVFPEMRPCLDGVCASSPHEARLGREEFGKEVHAYAPAWSRSDMDELLGLVDHIVFNSFGQWDRFRDSIPPSISVGLRVNPEYSEVASEIYNPCAKFSRLGIPRDQFDGHALRGISGLHFHVMCEQTSDVLERVLKVVEKQFGCFFREISWINFGGGHHITRADYDVEHLVRIVSDFRRRHPHLTVYIEPGEAAALNAGVLVSQVLDIVHNGMDLAILDTSAAAHMPDVLEMPYRPNIVGAGKPGEFPHTYRLGGLTCLAGDVIGDYSFADRLAVGDRLVFLDMAHYTMVKNTTFNGVRLPSIATYDLDCRALRVVRRFGYTDFRNRLS